MRPPAGTPCPTPPHRTIPRPWRTGPARSSRGWRRRRVPRPRIAPPPNVARATWRTICARSASTPRVRAPRHTAEPLKVSQPRVDAPIRGAGPLRSPTVLHHPAGFRNGSIPEPISLRGRSSVARRDNSGRRPTPENPASRSRHVSPVDRRCRDNARRPRRHRVEARSIRRSQGGSERTCPAVTPPDRTTGQLLPNTPTIPRRAVGERISIRLIRIGTHHPTDRSSGASRCSGNPLAPSDGSSLHWLTR